MKGFHFQMDSILTMRKHREEELQLELAAAQRVLDEETAEAARVDGEMKSRARSSAMNYRPGDVDVDILGMEGGYLHLLQSRLVAQRGLVDRQMARVSEARDHLLGASRDKKALETYRAKAVDAFVKEAAKKEQHAMEETAGVLRLHRQGAHGA